jgi:hypothetical protein
MAGGKTTMKDTYVTAIQKMCSNCKHANGCDKLCLENKGMWEPAVGEIDKFHAAVRRPQKGRTKK